MENNQPVTQPTAIPVPEPQLPPVAQTGDPGGSKKAMIIGVVVLVILLIAGAAYLYISYQGPAVPINPSASQLQGANLDALNQELESSGQTESIDEDFKTVDSDLQSL